MNKVLTTKNTKGTKNKAYPKYKPSGMEWLGDVPEHWEALPLRRIVITVKTGGTPTGAEDSAFDNEGFNWYSPSDFSDKIKLGKSNRSLSEDGKKEVRIFPAKTVMLVGIGATIGKIGLAINESSCNQQINGIICGKRLNPEFAAYYLKTMREFIVECGKYTTLPIINQDETKNLIFTLPPLSEQQAIAAFLDHETGRIDSLIAKKQRLLELLAEQLTALISGAVTKGLDASVKLKPSGVKWLGGVPTHWGIQKIRYIFTFRSGGTPSTENPDYWDGDIPWVSSKDMKKFYIQDTEDHINKIAIKESAANMIPANTLVVVMRSGILIHSIPASVLMHDMAINQDIKAFLPSTQLSATYFARFIEGFQKQLLTEWRKEGATVESLDMELIKNFQIILPPLPEQQAIAAFLDRETAKIDALSAKVVTVIERLKEYRAALISSAVTGKIDVSTGLDTSMREAS